MARGTWYETINTKHRIIERKDQRALGKLAGWVKWHWVKWNWVNCHVTNEYLNRTNKMNKMNKTWMKILTNRKKYGFLRPINES